MMDSTSDSTPKWTHINRRYFETLFASLIFLFVIFALVLFVTGLISDFKKGEWTDIQFAAIMIICLGIFGYIGYVLISTIYNEISLWRSLKGMLFIKLHIPSESMNTIIKQNLLKNHVHIESYEQDKWNKQLYLVNSYTISYKGQSSYLLIGDTTDEGEEPDIKIYIGPFTDKNMELRRIMEDSILHTSGIHPNGNN